MVKNSLRNWVCGLVFCFAFISQAYSQKLKPLQSKTKSSIRGLSVVDDSVAWVSGSGGWTSVTIDGGANWTWTQIPGYEKFDFRDIEAFSRTDAIVVNAGSPAVILRTNDGGNTWKEVYRNESPDIFLDGMDFKNRSMGVVYGDPINGKMQLLRTTNGGSSWENISNNLKVALNPGEASFAASGTGIRALKNGKLFIVSGGLESRIFVSADFGNNWDVFPCPIIKGKNSTGPFSIAFLNKKRGVAVGGDYLSDTSSLNNLLLTNSGGRTWKKPEAGPYGYKSSIEYISSKVLIATGTSGTDISRDGGKNWMKLSAEGFNVVQRAKNGSMVLLAGTNGRISIFPEPADL